MRDSIQGEAAESRDFRRTLLAALALLHDAQRPEVRAPLPTVILVAVGPTDLVCGDGIQRNQTGCEIRLTSVQDGVRFDLDGDGTPERVAWTARDAEIAFVGIDLDRNGRISSGNELFGSRMLPETPSGADALLHVFKQFDATVSGDIHQGHRLYDQLLLWLDRNHGDQYVAV